MIWFSLLQWSVMADLRFSCWALSFIARLSLSCLLSHCFYVIFLCGKTSARLPNVGFMAWFTWYFIYDHAFIVLINFELWVTSSCGLFVCGFTGVFIRCFFMTLWMRPLKYGSFTASLLSLFCSSCFFLSFVCVSSFAFTCCVPFCIAHCGYWHVFSAFWICCSSCALSLGSVVKAARSSSVLTTEFMCYWVFWCPK